MSLRMLSLGENFDQPVTILPFSLVELIIGELTQNYDCIYLATAASSDLFVILVI